MHGWKTHEPHEQKIWSSWERWCLVKQQKPWLNCVCGHLSYFYLIATIACTIHSTCSRFLCTRAMKEGNKKRPVIPSKSHSIAVFILLEGNLPKPGNPYCGPTTDRPLAQELKYSRNRAWWHWCPTNNLLEVWQNSAIFSGKSIGGAVKALSTKNVNRRSSVLPIVVFLLSSAARRCYLLLSCY